MSSADRPTNWSDVARWAATGLLVAVIVQAVNIVQLGDLAGALRLGAAAPTRPLVEAELGQIQLAEGTGHDGYQFLVIALDPLARDAEHQTVYYGYRHRRVLYPALAGLGGLLPGRAALAGMAVWNALGVALCAGAVAWLVPRLGAAGWGPAGAVANMGLLNSVQLLTADTLAIGFGLLAAALLVARRLGWAIVALTAAVLTKETSILFTVGAAGWLLTRRDWTAAALTLTVPTGVALAWAGYIEGTIGNGFATQRNLGWPLAGVAEGIGQWNEPGMVVLGLTALAGLIVAGVGAVRSRSSLLLSLTIPWILVTLVSSAVVWGDGNNALRVFSVLWIFGILGLAVRPGRAPKDSAQAEATAR
jgi:hypothetical protein